MRLICILASLATVWLAAPSTSLALPLWKLEGTSNHIYLLGSIHFLRAKDYPLPAAIMDTLEDADVVVMELDLSSVDPIGTQVVMMGIAVDPKGRNLETLLGARAYREAEDLAADIDIDLAILQPFEPWYAALQITQFRLLQLGFDGSYGVDFRLASEAIRQKKQIRGLETLVTQLEALDSLPPQAQEKYLLGTLEDAANLDDNINEIVDAWRAGDVNALERELAKGIKDQPTLYRHLLVNRNRNWTRQILEYIDEPQDYVIVVGAMHLVGDHSVQNMLEDAGYSSTQIKD